MNLATLLTDEQIAFLAFATERLNLRSEESNYTKDFKKQAEELENVIHQEYVRRGLHYSQFTTNA